MDSMRMPPWARTRVFLLAATTWTAAMGAILWQDIHNARVHAEDYAEASARGILAKDLAYRRWASMHGGVYVPVTDTTPPNPLLEGVVEERDITTPSGRALTLVNPAYMTRQVHQLFDQLYGARGHITSLDPIRAENAPDPWERRALEAFQEGVPEVAAVDTMEGRRFFRLMIPLVTEASCLHCHAQQGYREGDIRGGLSTAVPMAPYAAAWEQHVRTSAQVYAIIWLLGLVGLGGTERIKHRRLTEVESSEERLRESERFLIEAQRIGRLGYYDFDIVAGSWRGSALLEDLLGVPHAASHGVDAWLGAVHPDDREGMAAYLQQLLAEGTSFDREYRILRKSDGAVRWVWGLGELEKDAQGRPVRLVGTIQDVTDLHVTLRALEAAEERFRHATENAPDAIFRYRVHPEPGLEYVSTAVTGMTGYTPDELYAVDDLAVVIHPDDVPAVLASIDEDEPTREPLLVRWIRKDGEIIWVEQRTAPVRDRGGQVVAVDGIARDVTERLHAQQERQALEARLAQAQRLESVGRLAGGVAHDFNNMMGIIMGHADVALGAGGGEPAEPHLRAIVDASRRAADLTRKLLGFARQQAIHPQALDLNVSVPAMMGLLTRLIGENVELHWTPGEKLDLVHMDQTQVDQILTNLVVNARDAISGHGSVTLATRNIELDDDFCADHPGLEPGPYVELRVTDTGAGMSEEVQARLFEPFFTTKAPGAGSGLGLATVYGIVQQNRGVITVSSRPGEGAEFVIRLPRWEGDGPPDDVKEPATEALAGPAPADASVLLVEDERGILDLTAEILRRAGYTVHPASHPNQALSLLEEGLVPDLLLSDMVMPGMDGLRLAELVRAKTPRVRVLFVSGYSARILEQRGVDPESVPMLSKPFSREQLVAAVERVLRGQG